MRASTNGPEIPRCAKAGSRGCCIAKPVRPDWVTIPATIAGMLISSLPKYIAIYARAKAVGAVAEFWATVAASVLNAAVIGIAAFVLGRATWWLWGLQP